MGSEPEVDVPFKRVSANSGDASSHEEIPRAAHNRDVSSLLHQRVGSDEVQRPLVLGVQFIVQIEPLRPAHRLPVEVVVQSNGVVECHDVSKVVRRASDDVRGGVGCILAVVEDVVEEED
uniref:Uncharacterized protein n=1 Tax=Kalanchoe fedtschenkoi TaxID=63787 RepID=A0A7N0UUL5_KALFE